MASRTGKSTSHIHQAEQAGQDIGIYIAWNKRSHYGQYQRLGIIVIGTGRQRQGGNGWS